MGAVAVVGTHWGDEAKGKFVDLIGQDADLVIRYGGGPNAGHTVMVGEETYKFHLIPSGILNPRCQLIMADGMALDPAVLVGEIVGLEARGISTSHLRISHNAHVILPYHQLLDRLEEQSRGSSAIGTTGRGVGPCYEDKAGRRGIRMGDLIDPARLRSRLAAVLPQKNAILTRVYGASALDADGLLSELEPLAARLAPFVTDTTALAMEALAAGKRILFEGAQATLLDLDSGTYPYVTSSHPVAGGACLGTGIPPTAISQVLGVVKAYTTRVGSGTFPTELTDARGERIRERGQEYGTTTGRPRRCGWLDAVALRYSARLNGLTGICVGHLDVLAGFESVAICTAYLRNGVRVTEFPGGDVSHLDGCEPEYEWLPGWSETDMERVREFGDLPTNARNYVRRVSEIAGVPAVLVSIGPRRDQTLVAPDCPPPSALFTAERGQPIVGMAVARVL
ncbi:MAG: adenylosuccinate synthase [Capsulimonadales bacterium]|nr:adenylosuccinate synthase [Capsulimonadales bacterium]